jgi:hypothetical protein
MCRANLESSPRPTAVVTRSKVVLPVLCESDSMLRMEKWGKSIRDNAYRDLAHECMEAADKTKDPSRRLSLLDLARRWLRLATHVQDRKSKMGDALLDPPGIDPSSRRST